MKLLKILFFVFISSYLRTEDQKSIALICDEISSFPGETRQTLRDKRSAFIKINGNSGTLDFGYGIFNLTRTEELRYYFRRDSETYVIFDRITLNFDLVTSGQKNWEYKCERTTRI